MKKLSLIIFLLAVSCTRIDTPPEVTSKFWKAMTDHNLDEARKYAIDGSMDKVTFLGDSKIEVVNISDEYETTNDMAKVNTKLRITDRKGNTGYYEFDTVLLRANNLWKVDFTKTRSSIIAYYIKDFGKSLREMGKALGGAMEEMGKAVKDAFNDAKQNLDKKNNKENKNSR